MIDSQKGLLKLQRDIYSAGLHKITFTYMSMRNALTRGGINCVTEIWYITIIFKIFSTLKPSIVDPQNMENFVHFDLDGL